MRKTRVILGLLLIIAIVMVGCESQDPGSTSDDAFKLGIVVPLTGSFAGTGTECANGAEIAIKEINEAGGIMGMQIEVLKEDTLDSNTSSINAANKVIAEGADFILGPPISTQCTAMTPIIVSNEIPAFYRGVSTDVKLGEGWIYRCCAPDWVETEGVVKFVVEELEKTKIAIIHSNDEWGTKGYEKTAKSLREKYGIEPLIVEMFNTTDTDVTPQLLKIKNANPEVVIQYGSGEGHVYTLRQRLAVGFGSDFPWVSTGNLVDPGTLALMTEEECENVYVLFNSTFTGNPDERAVAFDKNFNSAYGYKPGPNAAIYYDAVYTIKKAVELAGSKENTKILDGLKQIEGLVGIAGIYTMHDDYESAYIAQMVQLKDKVCIPVAIMEW